MSAVEEFGEGSVEVVPIIKARAMPGGPVERPFYEHMKQTLLEGLNARKNLNGVYLAMHGSMGVQDLIDPEGDLITAVRETVGDSVPIVVSFDTQANVTRARIEAATAIVGYKTNPHRDFFKTGKKCGEILIRTIRGEIEPVMAWNKLPLLRGGEMQIDILPHMRTIFKWMKKMEKMDDVVSVSNFTVYLWLNNEPELGWSTVTVTDNNPSLTRELSDEIADMDWSVRKVTYKEGLSPEKAIEQARKSSFRRKTGAVLFSDSSDNVLAGAPGENTWILKALVKQAPDLISYITGCNNNQLLRG